MLAARAPHAYAQEFERTRRLAGGGVRAQDVRGAVRSGDVQMVLRWNVQLHSSPERLPFGHQVTDGVAPRVLRYH